MHTTTPRATPSTSGEASVVSLRGWRGSANLGTPVVLTSRFILVEELVLPDFESRISSDEETSVGEGSE